LALDKKTIVIKTETYKELVKYLQETGIKQFVFADMAVKEKLRKEKAVSVDG